MSSGQGNTLSPIVDFAYETVREKEWDNIVACHNGIPYATVWSYSKMKMGAHKLVHERFANAPSGSVFVSTVCMTACGNFALVGYNTGHLDRFNVQSGLHRCVYVKPTTKTAHDGSVRAVITDQLNQFVISGGNDRQVNFWHLNKGNHLGSLKVSAPVDHLRLHLENNLLAVSMDDYSLIIVDIETKRTVRRLANVHSNRITDMTFDVECRRLYTATMDSMIYIWDLVSGQLVDLFRVASPCTSLSLSPTGEFLATSHVNDLAIYLWANISIYTTVNLKPIDLENEQIKLLTLPSVRSDEEMDQENDEQPTLDTDNQNIQDEELETVYVSPEQLSSDLITFSGLASSRWKNLFNLELIRRRNKPKEPVQKPVAAPFFLSTISGLVPKFDLKASGEGQSKSDSSQIKNVHRSFVSPFGLLLCECASKPTPDFTEVLVELKQFGPSKIDAELSLLAPESCAGSTDYLLYFLNAIHWMITRNDNFELAQSYLALFLKIHTDCIVKQLVLVEECAKIADAMHGSWQRLSTSLGKSLCLINFLRNAVL